MAITFSGGTSGLDVVNRGDDVAAVTAELANPQKHLVGDVL
jgi:hypothetical protein